MTTPWRDDPPHIALEVVTADGTFYLPIQEYDEHTLMVPLRRGEWSHLTPSDLCDLWPQLEHDLKGRLLTAEEVDFRFPRLRQRRALSIDVRPEPPES